MTIETEGVLIEFSQHGHFDSFSIYRQNILPFNLSALPNPVATNLKTMSFVDRDVMLETTYHYMAATHRGSEVEYSDPVSIFVTFTPPYNVSGTWNETTGVVDLTWEFDW